MYSWLVFVHLVGVFGFLMSHGVATFVAFRVRAEKDVLGSKRNPRARSARGVVFFRHRRMAKEY